MTSIKFMTSVKYFKFAWLLPVAAVAACSGPTEPQFVQADATQIRQRTQEYEAGFNTKDVAKVAVFYPGESILLPPNAPTIRGREGIEKFYVDLYAQGATDLEMDTRDVRGHGSLAYESGTYQMNRRPQTGDALRDRGKYIFIWRKLNNVWSIEYSIWSSDLPAMVPIAK
jgi:ketosteroid isomerase-like protein